MALATQAQVEAFNQLDFDADPDPTVTIWLDAASKAAEQFCQRPLERQDGRVETFTGDGFHKRWLTMHPIEAGSVTITEDGDALVEDTDYLLDYETGLLRRILDDSKHPRGWGSQGKLENVEVTYSAGYILGATGAQIEVPADLSMAIALAVGDIFRAGHQWTAAGGATRVTLEGIGTMDYGGGATGAMSFAGAMIFRNPVVTNLLAPYQSGVLVSAGGDIVR